MKRILTLFLLIITSILLVSCKEKEKEVFYTVTYEVDGGSPIDSQTIKKGNKIPTPTTTKEGFEIDGWFIDSEFQTEWNFSVDVVNDDVTLYVKWKVAAAPTLTMQEYINLLLENSYTRDDLAGIQGLSTPELVGVEEDKIVEKHALKEDSFFESNAIFDFEAIKIEGNLNDVEAWDEVVTRAKAVNNSSTPVKIKLPNRDINLLSGASTTTSAGFIVTLSGFQGLYLEGQSNTVLLMETPTVWSAGLLLNDSQDVQINNVKIDYKYLPTLTGIIKDYSVEELSITMDVPESQRGTLLKYIATPNLSKNLYSFVEYNAFTNAPKEKGNILIAAEGHFRKVEFIDNNETKLDQVIVYFENSYASNFQIPRVNDKVALGFAMYGNNGITISNSENVRLENVKVYTAPGMGLLVSSVKDLSVNRFGIEIIEDRLMTITADGIHIVNSLGTISITNSIIENTHDDGLNIKSGYYYALSSVNPVEKTIVLSKKTETIPMPNVGDIIEIYGSNDYDFRARLTVAEVTGNVNTMEIKTKERLSTSVDWLDAVATNVSFSASFEFKNNIVRNKRNRGILVQVREAVIENNSFEYVGHGAISVHTALDIFNEATLPDNIRISNNKFCNNGYLPYGSLRGDIAVFAYATGGKVAPPETIKNVTINNNFIANAANTAISFRGVGGEGVSIENNLIYNSGRLPASSLTEGGIELENVRNIKVMNNYNHYTLESDNYSGLIVAGLTNMDTVELVNNYNLSVKSDSGEQVIVKVSKVIDSEITIDGNVSEWATKGTAFELIGSSLATGDEIMPNEYASYFGVELAKTAYSDTGIYFAFDIRDDRLEFKTIHDFWTGDIIEIFLSDYLLTPNADFMLIKNEGDVLQAAFCPSWENKFILVKSRTNDTIYSKASEIQVKMVYTTKGYSCEIFIPFTVIPNVQQLALQNEGVAIAVIFADGDRDDIGRKRLQVGNVPHFVEAYKTKTAKMPLYVFNENE